jgi:chromosomal replication initiation ATPase DnaA
MVVTANKGSVSRQAQRAQAVAARMCGITLGDLGTGGGHTAFARQLAMYLANRVYGMSHTRTAAMFGRERDAASYACRRIDALREDPKFDWQVFEVETLLRAAEVVARSQCDMGRDAGIAR